LSDSYYQIVTTSQMIAKIRAMIPVTFKTKSRLMTMIPPTQSVLPAVVLPLAREHRVLVLAPMLVLAPARELNLAPVPAVAMAPALATAMSPSSVSNHLHPT
jgi:hypothetical protein